MLELTVKKKPVTVQAMQFIDDAGCVLALKEWMRADPLVVDYADGEPRLKVHTLEGDMYADEGDYIIRGINGEYYPCKPGIFFKTYSVESVKDYYYDEEMVEEISADEVSPEDLNA